MLSPSYSFGNHSRRIFQKTIAGFDCKINGRALDAVLRHSFGRSDRQAQTQVISESAAVAAGSNQHAPENLSYYTDLVLEPRNYQGFVIVLL